MSSAIRPPAASAQSPRYAARLDSLFTILEAHNRLMGAVTVRQDGRVRYHRTFGYRDLDGPVPQRSDAATRFRVGSVAKVFTAVLVHQLIDARRLTLDTRLSDFFPDIVNASQITISHLLSHTSGIPDHTVSWPAGSEPTPEALRAHLNTLRPARFAPGARREYSNTNFLLLGWIIERVTGQPYATVVAQRITAPLGLLHTRVGGPVDPTRNEARSYYFGDGRWTLQPDDDLRLAGGAGAVVSTTNDLTRFVSALFAGRLLSPRGLQAMTTPPADSLGLGGRGIGPLALDAAGKKGHAHDGSAGAFTALLGYVPEDRIAVAITINGHNYPQSRVFFAIWDAIYNVPRPLPSFTPVALADSVLARYAGTYAMGPSLTITVRADSGRLSAQTTGQSPFALMAVGPRTFQNITDGILIEFAEPSAGRAPAFTLFQQKYGVRLTRTELR